jgi:hypothetical protein
MSLGFPASGCRAAPKAGTAMPVLLLLRVLIVRVLAFAVVVGAAYLMIATVDAVFGTSVIFVIWQWLARFWLYLLKWFKVLSRFMWRWIPGLFKRFLFRKSLSGFTKIATSAILAFVFYLIGGRRYRRLEQLLNRSRSSTVRFAQLIWSTEIWFFPKWLRALTFVVASIGCLVLFARIQEWADARNSPTLLGIDPWSFTFGLVASFFLTHLPLMGFDHFLNQIFRPLRHRYQRLIRRRGWPYRILNWLLALRPARRYAELERKRFMRRWHWENVARRQEAREHGDQLRPDGASDRGPPEPNAPPHSFDLDKAEAPGACRKP